MPKLDPLKVLKQVKARADHFCSHCGNGIFKGQVYYREQIADAFLHSPHARKFCAACYEKYTDRILKQQ